MNPRLVWVPVLLLGLAGLYILFFPLPSPALCFWGWGGLGSEIALKNCAWNTSREGSGRFLLPALFGLALLVAAAWSAAVLLGVRVRIATTIAAAILAVAGSLALLAFSASVDTNRLPVQTAAPVAIRPTDQPPALGSLFDPPPPYPGYQWTRNGVPISNYELTTAAGPEHCGLQSATFLTIGWPPGTVSTSAAQARLYIRDPRGVITERPYRQRLDLHAMLPSDARPTGYRYGPLEIYLSPSDQDEAIYVVGPSGAERWPRSDPMTLCI